MRKIREKWILNLAIILLVVLLCPMISYASEIQSRASYTCANESQLRSALTSSNNGAVIYLTNDISVTSRIYVKGTKYLYGNGHWIINNTPVTSYTQSSIICKGTGNQAFLYLYDTYFNGNNKPMISYHVTSGSNLSANLVVEYHGGCYAQNCYFANSRRNENSTSYDDTGSAVAADGDVTFKNCTFTDSATGVNCSWKGKFYNCVIQNNQTKGLIIAADAERGVVSGCNINNNGHYGILNYVSLDLISSSICVNGWDGVRNLANLTIQNSNLYGNGESGLNNQGGYAELKSGNIYNNGGNGVNNLASFRQKGGAIFGNGSWGIYQSGDYYMSSYATVNNNNFIHLCPNRVITVEGKLINKKCGTIDTQPGDRQIGRILTSNSYDLSGASDVAVESQFNLSYLQNDRDSKDKEVHTSSIRAGSRSGNNGRCLLSGIYQVEYEANMDKVVQTDTPEPTTFYWKEETVIPTTVRVIPFITDTISGEKKDLSSTLLFQHWTLDQEGKEHCYLPNESFIFEQNTKLYGQWDVNYQLNYRGNGATGGKEFSDTNVRSDYILKDNPFHRSEDTMIYDANEDKKITYVNQYSYQGWSTNKDTIYNSQDVHHPGEKVDMKKLLLEQIASGDFSWNEDGKICLDIHAVWDQYPMIEAYDIYINEEDLDEFSPEQLYDRVSSLDKEDGKLVPKQNIIVLDYNKDELLLLSHTGCATITYQATDYVGNKTTKKVRVWVNDKQPMKRFIYYPRFISEEFYNTYQKDDYDKNNYKDYGGCYPTSKWYTDKSYQTLITKAFSNLKSNTPVEVWKFTHEEVIRTQEWIDAKGLGKCKNQDALKEWYLQFNSCKQK